MDFGFWSFNAVKVRGFRLYKQGEQSRSDFEQGTSTSNVMQSHRCMLRVYLHIADALS